MKTRAGVFSVSICLLCASVAQAQEGLTIRQTVQEVMLEVVARDSHGRIVKNLKPGDFEVYEDGVRQEVRSFQLIQGRDVVADKVTATPAAKVTAAIANPLKAVNLICIVFHNLDPFTKKFAVDAAQEFLKNQLEPNTWVAVFSLDESLTVLHPFTTNRNEIMQAAAKAYTGQTVDFARSANAVLTASPNMSAIEVVMSGNPATGGTVSASQSVTGGELNTSAILGAEVSNSTGANIARGDLVGQRRQFGGIEGMREIDQMLAMIRQLGTLPGRKSVLLLSPGIATTGDAELFKAMVDKANKANVTIYGIDVNGLSQNSAAVTSRTALQHVSSVSASQGRGGNGSAAANMEKMRQGDYVQDAVRTTDTQASLRGLSEGTGGFLIGSTNDLRKPFQRVLEEVDTHYEVIYHASSGKYDGRLRSIEVKAARPDVSLQSRTGYYALPVLGTSPELAPYEMTALAALNVHTPPHAFDFRFAAYQFRPAAGNSRNAVVFEMPAASLAAKAEPELKRHRLHVAVFALIKDASGQVVDKFSQDAPYEIADEKLEAVRKNTVTLTHPISLPPGHYTVETAALDREAGRASTNKIEFDSPEEKGVGLSSILLVQRMEPVKGQVDASDPLQFQAQPTEGQRVIPELTTSLGADAHPYVYFVVYPDKSIAEKPKIQAEFLVGGRVLAKQVADLPAPDAAGAIPMLIGAATKPGNCELRISALQGTSLTMQSIAYTIAAK